MPVQANQRYKATVWRASIVTSANKGTMGIEIVFDTERDGEIQHTIWLTEKTVEFAKRDLAILGVTADEFESESALENIGSWLPGRVVAVEITTNEEFYNNKSRVRVQFINEWRYTPANTGRMLANLFGKDTAKKADAIARAFAAGGKPAPQPPVKRQIDDDAPF